MVSRALLGFGDLVPHTFLLGTASQLDAARLEAVLDASSDAFFDVDLAAQTIRWSRGVTLLFGHDPARVGSGLDAWRSYVHPNDVPRIRESGRRVLPFGTDVWSDELRLARADGSYAPVRVRAVIIREENDRASHVVGAVTDLSDLREREEELERANEELSRSLAAERRERARADALSGAARAEVLAEWEIATDRLHLSSSAEAILGYAASEIADVASALRYSHPDDGPRALSDLRRAIDSGADSWSGRVRFERRDRAEIVLHAMGSVIRDADGHATTVIGSLVPLVAATEVGAGHVPAGEVPGLTGRQLRALELVRAGRTNKEIAGELGIGEQAAKAQVRRLMRRFGVPNRAALAALARHAPEAPT